MRAQKNPFYTMPLLPELTRGEIKPEEIKEYIASQKRGLGRLYHPQNGKFPNPTRLSEYNQAIADVKTASDDQVARWAREISTTYRSGSTPVSRTNEIFDNFYESMYLSRIENLESRLEGFELRLYRARRRGKLLFGIGVLVGLIAGYVCWHETTKTAPSRTRPKTVIDIVEKAIQHEQEPTYGNLSKSSRVGTE